MLCQIRRGCKVCRKVMLVNTVQGGWLSIHVRLSQNNPESQASKTHLKGDGKSGMHQPTCKGHHLPVSLITGLLQVWRESSLYKTLECKSTLEPATPPFSSPVLPDRDASVLQQDLEAGITLHITNEPAARHFRLSPPLPASPQPLSSPLGTVEQSLPVPPGSQPMIWKRKRQSWDLNPGLGTSNAHILSTKKIPWASNCLGKTRYVSSLAFKVSVLLTLLISASISNLARTASALIISGVLFELPCKYSLYGILALHLSSLMWLMA